MNVLGIKGKTGWMFRSSQRMRHKIQHVSRSMKLFVFLGRFWAEKFILPTTSWVGSKSCTIMESHTPQCQMTLRASSPSSSGSPTCRRFVRIVALLNHTNSWSISFLLAEQAVPCSRYTDHRSRGQRDRIYSYKSSIWPPLDACRETSPQWVKSECFKFRQWLFLRSLLCAQR